MIFVGIAGEIHLKDRAVVFHVFDRRRGRIDLGGNKHFQSAFLKLDVAFCRIDDAGSGKDCCRCEKKNGK